MLVPASGSLPPADAALQNCGSVDVKDTGEVYNPDPSDFKVRGSMAEVTLAPVDVCNAGHSWSRASVMLFADTSSDFAFIGTIKDWSIGSWSYEWEYLAGPGLIRHVWGSPAVGQTTRFVVERKSSDGKIHMYLHGNPAPCNPSGDCAVTPYDPLDAWGGIQSRWVAETNYPQNDIFGIGSDKGDFDFVKSKNPEDSWSAHAPTSTSHGAVCYYNINVLTNDHFKVWTHPLDHNC